MKSIVVTSLVWLCSVGLFPGKQILSTMQYWQCYNRLHHRICLSDKSITGDAFALENSGELNIELFLPQPETLPEVQIEKFLYTIR